VRLPGVRLAAVDAVVMAIWTSGHAHGSVVTESAATVLRSDDAREAAMQVLLHGFGSIEVDGLEYEHDIVIDGGEVRKRKKKPSKPYREEFGHTPVSIAEELPWGGSRLIIGTGAYGSLPIMPEVMKAADRRGVELDAVPTEEACRLIAGLDSRDVYAVLHVTC
jgi:hypothetical protein